jgi:hypothetical protein
MLSSPGGNRLVHPDGEKAAAAAAGPRADRCRGDGDGASVEEVAAAAAGRCGNSCSWPRALAPRVDRAGHQHRRQALLTVDIPVSPFPVIPDMVVPGPELNRQNMWKFGPEGLRRPRWLAGSCATPRTTVT